MHELWEVGTIQPTVGVFQTISELSTVLSFLLYDSELSASEATSHLLQTTLLSPINTWQSLGIE